MSSSNGFLRSPWNHTVLFDTKDSTYVIDHKDNLLKSDGDEERVFVVSHNNKSWLLIKISLSPANLPIKPDEIDLDITMMKDGCGMLITNKSSFGTNLKSSIFAPTAITSLLKEFGVVVLRGFARFEEQKQLFDQYLTHGTKGIVPYRDGSVRVLKPNADRVGNVHTKEGLPIHWDMNKPPEYMNI